MQKSGMLQPEGPKGAAPKGESLRVSASGRPKVNYVEVEQARVRRRDNDDDYSSSSLETRSNLLELRDLFA